MAMRVKNGVEPTKSPTDMDPGGKAEGGGAQRQP